MAKMLKESALLLLIWFVLILLGTTTLFFFHIGITKLHFILFGILTSGVYFVWKRRETTKKEFFKIIGLSLLIILISTVTMSFLYDRSSDGNTYHKDAIGVLKEGFNPVYESSEEFIKRREDDSKEKTEYSIWTDHYAKANWIIAANFYSLTGNIESGKAMNIISIYILFGLLCSNLIKKLGSKKAFLLSMIVVINPITAAQVFTYYNDQLVCMYLFLAILQLIKLDKNPKDKENWIIYCLTFIILSNMKFNGLGYLLVFSFLFVCKNLYRAYQEKEFLITFHKLCFIFIPLFVVSLGIVGYSTYVKNTLDHQNPFFPLYDDNGEDIITAQQPQEFLKMNNIQKLFYGTFSKANNLRENDNTTLKIPFMIYKDEITLAMSNDLRISGWGIWFSGLLICSIGILITKYQQYKKDSWIIYVLAITGLLLLVMSESWWARYTPHFYLFIILSLYVLLKYGKNKIIKILFIIGIGVNTLLPLTGNTYYTLKNSIQITKDLKRLENKEIKIDIKGMNGILYNLKDFHIRYKLDDSINGEELYYHYTVYQGEEL